jgi:heme exporter protein C
MTEKTKYLEANQASGIAGKGMLDVLAPVALVVGALLTTAAFVLSFTTAPLVMGAGVEMPALIGGQMVTNKLLLSQKIFYFHMPVAVISMAALAFTAVFGAIFLVKRNRRWDLCAKVATEIALVFVLCTMVSGELWERYEWGVWWTWEPRLTTYFILMLMVIGYFVLRNAIDDPERRAVFASVFGIIAFIDVPICLLVTRLIPSSVHPVIFRTDSGLSPNMLLPLLLAMFGFAAIAFSFYRLRLREQRLRERIDTIKESLED